MSCIINRRFLEVSLLVNGIVSEPPATVDLTHGLQYIVASNPTGVFANATPGYIARYNLYESKWLFIKPQPGYMEVINLETKQLLNYNGTTWVELLKFGADDEGGVAAVLDIINTGDTLPDTSTIGDKFLNVSDNKLYTATAENIWDNGVALTVGNRYASITNKMIYEYTEDNELVSKHVFDGALFLNKANNRIYSYNSTSNSFTAMTSTTMTENHSLTQEEITNKSFDLTYNISPNNINNTLLFMGGVLQIYNDDFTINGKTISWNNKGIENIDLESNTIATVIYSIL